MNNSSHELPDSKVLRSRKKHHRNTKNARIFFNVGDNLADSRPTPPHPSTLESSPILCTDVLGLVLTSLYPA